VKVAEGNFKGHMSLIVFRRQRGFFVFLKEAEGLINPFGHVTPTCWVHPADYRPRKPSV
jgi:hypothetical protein